jgi:hypothetical protein
MIMLVTAVPYVVLLHVCLCDCQLLTDMVVEKDELLTACIAEQITHGS